MDSNMSNADDITVAAARAATPPKSQLDMLGTRVTELERRVAVLVDHQDRIVRFSEGLRDMQVKTVEEVTKQMNEFVNILRQKQQSEQPQLPLT